MFKLRKLIKKYRKCINKVIFKNLINNVIFIIYRNLFR